MGTRHDPQHDRRSGRTGARLRPGLRQPGADADRRPLRADRVRGGQGPRRRAGPEPVRLRPALQPMTGAAPTAAPVQRGRPNPAAAGESPALEGAAPAAGRNDLGSITVSESVVAKLAAQAAMEVPDAGAAAPRLLGRSVSGAGGLGVRQTSLSGLPKVSAKVDNSIALVRLELSVRWPASVPAVTAAVRQQ